MHKTQTCTYPHCTHTEPSNQEGTCLFHADVDKKDPQKFYAGIERIFLGVANSFNKEISAIKQKNLSMSDEKIQELAAKDIKTDFSGFQFPDSEGMDVFSGKRYINLDLQGAYFKNRLMIDDVEIIGYLSLVDIKIQGNIYLRKIKIYGDVHLRYSIIPGHVFLQYSQIHGDVLFHETKLQGGIFWEWSTIQGDVFLQGAKIQGDISLSESVVQGNVDLWGADVQGNVILQAAKINGGLYLLNSNIQGKVDLWAAEVQGSVSLNNAICMQSINLFQTEMDLLTCKNAHIHNGLNLAKAQISKDAFFEGSTIGGRTDFSNARFGQKAFFNNTVFYDSSAVVPDKDAPAQETNAINNEKVLVDFTATSFGEGAAFIGTRFLVPTLFHYTDISKNIYNNVWLGLCSVNNTFIGSAIFSNCSWNSLHKNEKLKCLSRYDGILEDAVYSQEDIHIPPEICGIQTLELKSNSKEGTFDWELEEEPKEIKVNHICDHQLISDLVWKNAATSLHNQSREIISIYQKLKKNHENSGNPVDAGEFYFGEMQHKGYVEKAEKKRIPYVIRILYRLLNGYGERPWRALAWIGMHLLLFSFIYLFGGLEHAGQQPHYNTIDLDKHVQSKSMQKTQPHKVHTPTIAKIRNLSPDYRTIRYDSPFPFMSRAFWSDYAISLDYTVRNILPFIQRDNKSILPANETVHCVTMLEQFFGAILISLFILAFRRRFKR